VTDRDFQEWQGELVTSQVRDALRLSDYLPAEIQECLRGLSLPTFAIPPFISQLLPYTWVREEHFKKAMRWCKGAVAAGKEKPPEKFLFDSLSNTYNLDRAFRAASVVDTQPLLRKSIPAYYRCEVGAPCPEPVMTPDGEPPSVCFSKYDPAGYLVLVKKSLSWEQDTPDEASDAVALVLGEEPPDEFWLAEYVDAREVAKKNMSEKYDPIIYARYGQWHVEVARWD
jgi:hypothetical protein